MRRLIALTMSAGLSLGACADRGAEVPAAEFQSLLRTGIAHLEDERPGEAARTFEELSDRARDDAAGPANLAIAEAQRGEFAAARRAASEAVRRAPEDADVRVIAGNIARAAGAVDEARESYAAAVAADPDNFAANWALAELDESADPLERILERSPANLAVRARAARHHAEAGRLDGAVRHLERLQQLIAPGDSELRSELRTAIESGLRGESSLALRSIRATENLLRVDPLYAQSLSALGEPPGGLLSLPLERSTTPMPGPEGSSSDVAFAEEAGDPLAASGALAADFDVDGDEDLVLLEGERIVCVWSDEGEERVDDACGPETPLRYLARAADFDGDAAPDVLASGIAGPVILRGEGEGFVTWGSFPEVGSSGGPLMALDADHDGDLDVLAAGPGGLRLFRHAEGGRFEDVTAEAGLAGVSGVTTMDFGDLDADGDIDVVATHAGGIAILRNIRYGSFLIEGAGESAAGIRVADVDRDGWFDLVVPGESGPVVATNDGTGTFADFAGPPASEGVSAFEIADLNGDGYADALEIRDGILRVYVGEAGGFADIPVELASDADWLAVRDADGDADPDIEVGGPSSRWRLRNDGEAGSFFEVGLLALADGSGKVNRFGIGSRLDVWTEGGRQARVVTGPLERFGLAGAESPDVVRIEWTNGVPQSVLDPPPGTRLTETQVLKGSCGFLYVWTGDRFEFVTDMMWKSALGMPLGIMAGERFYAPPEPSLEYVRIPPGALRPRNGLLDLRISEELWEVGYLDEVRLLAVDHPPGVEVYVNEAFARPEVPNERLYTVRHPHPVQAAVDHAGRDVTEVLARRDFVFVGGFVPGPFQGTTEPHDLVLSLPEAAGRGSRLFLSGWLFPTDASINVRIGQAGGGLVIPPALAVPDGRGGWRELDTEVSFPTGKNKTVVVELPEGVPVGDPRLRIHTSMEIYWDEAFYTVEEAPVELRRNLLEVQSASIRWRGFSRPYRRGGRYGPHWFDYGSISQESPWRPLAGNYTRYGDVTELLELADDRYVVFGPGDEISVSFPAPEPPEGRQRTYFLYSDAFLKDADLNTLGGDAVEPLPYHGQSSYPPAERHRPDYEEFAARYLTREVTVVPEHLRGTAGSTP